MYWDLKPNTNPFVIATVYIPPSTSVDTLIKVEHEVDDEDKEFYIVGDLNCNMLDTYYEKAKFNYRIISTIYNYISGAWLINLLVKRYLHLLRLYHFHSRENNFIWGDIPAGISDHKLIYVVR